MKYSSGNFEIETAMLTKRFYPEKDNLLSNILPMYPYKILA
jgi:hypothetical protein